MSLNDLNRMLAEDSVEKSPDVGYDEIDPNFSARVRMSHYISELHGLDARSVYDGYEDIAPAYGYTDNPLYDLNGEQARLSAQMEYDEPSFFGSIIGSMKRGGTRVAQTGDNLSMVNYHQRMENFLTLAEKSRQDAERIKSDPERIKDFDFKHQRRKNAPLGFFWTAAPSSEEVIAAFENQAKSAEKSAKRMEMLRDEQAVESALRQAKILSIPMSKRLAEFKSEEGKLTQLLNPATFAELAMEEMIASSPALAAAVGGTAVAGTAGGAAGGGVVTYAQGVGNNFFSYLSQNGVDTSDPEAILKAIEDKDFYNEAMEYAFTRSAPEALAAALSIGVAGKGNPVVNALFVQTGLAGAGSAASSLIVGEDIDIKDLVTEMAIEIPGGTIEVVSSRLMNGSDKFKRLTRDGDIPPKGHDLKMMAEAESMDSLTEGMTEQESFLVRKSAEGDKRADKAIQRISAVQKSAEDLGIDTALIKSVLEFDTKEVLSGISPFEEGDAIIFSEKEMPLTTKERKSIEKQIRDLDKSDFRLFQDNTPINSLEDKINEAFAKRDAEMEALQKEWQAELDAAEIAAEGVSEGDGVEIEESLSKSDEKAVSDLLGHLSGEKKLSPSQLAKVRERIAGSSRLKKAVAREVAKSDRVKAKLESKISDLKTKLKELEARRKRDINSERKRARELVAIAKEETRLKVQERADQRYNDLALKLRLTVKKMRAQFSERINRIQSDLKARIISERQAAMDQRRSAAEAIRQVERFQNQLNMRLPKGDRMKGISVADISSKATLESLERILESKLSQLETAFSDAVVRVKARTAKQKAKSIQSHLQKASKGQIKSRYDADISKALSEYISLLGMSNDSDSARAAARSDLDLLNERIDSRDDYELSDEDFAVVEKALIPNLNSKTLSEAEIDEVISNLDSLEESGKTKRKRDMETQKRKIEVSAGIVATEISIRNESKGKTMPEEVREIETTFNRLRRKAKYDLLDYRSVSALLTGKRRSKLESLVFDSIAERFSVGLVNQQIFTDAVNAKAKSLGVDFSSMGTTQLTTIGTRRISVHEAMFVYGHNQNERGRAHLAATYFGGVPLKGEVVREIESALPQRYKDFTDFLIDHFDRNVYPRLNEVFRKRFGVDMPKENRYLPIKALSDVSADSNVFSDHMQYAGFRMNNMKSRKGARIGWGSQNLDLIGSVMSSIANTEHVIATYESVRKAEAIMSDERVRRELAKRDPDSIKWVNKYLNGVARGTFDAPSRTHVEIASHLRQNAAASLTAVNVASWLKTLAPIAAAQKDLSPGSMAAVLSKPWEHADRYEFAKSMSPLMAARRHANRIEVAELAESMRRGKVIPGLGVASRAAAAYKNTTNRFKELGWAVYSALDAFATTVVWTAKFNEQIGKNADERMAVREADRMVNVYFPSGRVDQLPIWFTSGGLERQLTTFTADMNRMLNLGFSGQQLADGKTMEAIMFVAFPVVLSSLYLAGTDFVGDSIKELLGLRDEDENKDEQYWKDVARYSTSQMVGGLPILGQAIEGRAAQLVGDDAAAWYLGQHNMVFTSMFQDIHRDNYISAISKAAGVPGANYWALAVDKYLKEESTTNSARPTLFD